MVVTPIFIFAQIQVELQGVFLMNHKFLPHKSSRVSVVCSIENPDFRAEKPGF
jgi:hypothetical protein